MIDTGMVESLRSTYQGRYDLDWLKDNVPSGVIRKNDSIAFWGRQSPFSNFYKCSFTVPTKDRGDVLLDYSEQYFMYRKAMLFGDVIEAHNILRSGQKPASIRKAGRRVRGFIKETWDKECESAMFDAVLYKFTGDASMREALLATGDKLLIEASPTDTIWGIGLATENRDGSPSVDWMHLDKWLDVLLHLQVEDSTRGSATDLVARYDHREVRASQQGASVSVFHRLLVLPLLHAGSARAIRIVVSPKRGLTRHAGRT